MVWLVHYVEIISLLLSPKNVIDAVQSECNQISRKATDETDNN